jgi:hypothetical protein
MTTRAANDGTTGGQTYVAWKAGPAGDHAWQAGSIHADGVRCHEPLAVTVAFFVLVWSLH